MKNFIALFLLITLSSTVIFAQKDNWDIYMASFEKGPGSVIINMSAKNYAPVKNLPFLLVTGVTFKHCDSTGFPPQEEFATLYTISDSVKSALEKVVIGTQVATFTYQCRRRDYYYVHDTTGLRNLLEKVYNTYFKDYAYTNSITADTKWDSYLNGLYPSEVILEYMRNDKVLMKLTEAGDKLEKTRQVDHWIYFPTEKDRDCFINYANSQHFKVENKEKANNGMRPFKLQISRIDKVDITSISNLTIVLRKEAVKCNGEYDGWETFIIKD